MTPDIKLSKQDREVINILWDKGKLNVNELLLELGTDSWTRHTVRANLLRLCEKGLVDVEKISERKQYYYPLIKKDDFLAAETSTYLHERYDGLKHMVAGLALGKKVSAEELKELSEFLQTLINEDE